MAVLEHGRLSYTDLARASGLNRTTTYSVARDLLSRGLLQEDFSSPVKALVIASPEALMTTTAREEAALSQKKNLIKSVVDEIRSAPAAAGYVAPAITFIPEQRIAQYLKQRNDEWNDSLVKTDKTWWGFNDADFIAQYGSGWLDWYWSRIIQAGGFVSVNTGGTPDGNAIPVPKPDADLAMDAAACIGCGACVAVCKNASAMLFVAAKVSHLSLLPQGKVEKDRRALNMVRQMDAEGLAIAPSPARAKPSAPRKSASASSRS